MSDDGADADGVVAAACLYSLDCSEKIFEKEPDIERFDFIFNVKAKWGGNTQAVLFSIGREEFEKVDLKSFRAKVEENYNNMWTIARVVMFGGSFEERLKGFDRASAVANKALYR